MTSLDNALVAHYDVDGVRFEVYVDKEKAYEYKHGAKNDFGGILVVDEIFKDAKKGERHKNEALEKAFGTADPRKVAEIIIDKGELPLTTDQKRKLTEEKRKKVIAIILREAIDPRTKAPITPVRLENALGQVKVHIDPFKRAEEQVDAVVNVLKPVLPIKFEKIRVAVKIPAQHAQRCFGILKEYGVKKEEWMKTGALVAVLEIPAGLQPELYNKLNSMTHGDIETKILE